MSRAYTPGTTSVERLLARQFGRASNHLYRLSVDNPRLYARSIAAYRAAVTEVPHA